MNMDMFFLMNIFEDPIVGRQFRTALYSAIVVCILFAILCVKYRYIFFYYIFNKKKNNSKDNEKSDKTKGD